MSVRGEDGVTVKASEPLAELRNVVVKPPSPSLPDTVDERKAESGAQGSRAERRDSPSRDCAKCTALACPVDWCSPRDCISWR